MQNIKGAKIFSIKLVYKNKNIMILKIYLKILKNFKVDFLLLI